MTEHHTGYTNHVNRKNTNMWVPSMWDRDGSQWTAIVRCGSWGPAIYGELCHQGACRPGGWAGSRRQLRKLLTERAAGTPGYNPNPKPFNRAIDAMVTAGLLAIEERGQYTTFKILANGGSPENQFSREPLRFSREPQSDTPENHSGSIENHLGASENHSLEGENTRMDRKKEEEGGAGGNHPGPLPPSEVQHDPPSHISETVCGAPASALAEGGGGEATMQDKPLQNMQQLGGPLPSEPKTPAGEEPVPGQQDDGTCHDGHDESVDSCEPAPPFDVSVALPGVEPALTGEPGPAHTDDEPTPPDDDDLPDFEDDENWEDFARESWERFLDRPIHFDPDTGEPGLLPIAPGETDSVTAEPEHNWDTGTDMTIEELDEGTVAELFRQAREEPPRLVYPPCPGGKCFSKPASVTAGAEEAWRGGRYIGRIPVPDKHHEAPKVEYGAGPDHNESEVENADVSADSVPDRDGAGTECDSGRGAMGQVGADTECSAKAHEPPQEALKPEPTPGAPPEQLPLTGANTGQETASPKKRKLTKVEQAKLVTEKLLDAYQAVTGRRARALPRRISMIGARLDEGFDAIDLRQALLGWWHCEFYRRENVGDFDWPFTSGEKVEKCQRRFVDEAPIEEIERFHEQTGRPIPGREAELARAKRERKEQAEERELMARLYAERDRQFAAIRKRGEDWLTDRLINDAEAIRLHRSRGHISAEQERKWQKELRERAELLGAIEKLENDGLLAKTEQEKSDD
jgi:hypothetical protein